MLREWNFWSQVLRSPDGDGGAAGDPPAGDPPVDPPAGDPPADLPADPAGDPPKTEQEQTVPLSVFQRRINQLTAQKAKLEADLALKSTQGQAPAPAAAQSPGLTQADVESRARDLVEANEFNRRCNEVLQHGRTAATDFDGALAALKSVAGGQLPKDFLDAVLEVDAPHDVIYALGKDASKAAQIFDLSPAKQAIALAKLEIELKTKVKPKPVTKAPPPIEPQVSGAAGRNSGTIDLADSTTDINAWMEARKKQVSGKRRR